MQEVFAARSVMQRHALLQTHANRIAGAIGAFSGCDFGVEDISRHELIAQEVVEPKDLERFCRDLDCNQKQCLDWVIAPWAAQDGDFMKIRSGDIELWSLLRRDVLEERLSALQCLYEVLSWKIAEFAQLFPPMQLEESCLFYLIELSSSLISRDQTDVCICTLQQQLCGLSYLALTELQ